MLCTGMLRRYKFKTKKYFPECSACESKHIIFDYSFLLLENPKGRAHLTYFIRGLAHCGFQAGHSRVTDLVLCNIIITSFTADNGD